MTLLGSVYVYSRSGGSWVETARLTASDGVGSAAFGASVAISADTLVIGAPWDDDNGTSSGSVYLFSRSGDSWVETAKLTASDGRAFDVFGYSVAIDADTVAIGATQFRDGAGSAYVFSRYGDSWVETVKLIAPDGAVHDGFGSSIAVAGDTVMVGAPRDDDKGTSSGSVYLFVASGGRWVEEAKRTASDGAAYDRFGWSVAADGGTVAIGAFGGDGNVKD